MALIPLVGGLSNVLGGGLTAYGEQQAAKRQSALQQQGIKNALPYLQQGYEQAVDYLSPYSQVGSSATQQYLQSLSSFNPSDYVTATQEDFTYDDPTLSIDQFYDPSMEYRLQAGVSALDASAANRGALRSGAQQKELEAYGQNLASEEYANAYNRMMQQAQLNQTNKQMAYQQYIDKAKLAQAQTAEKLSAYQTQMSGLGNLASMGASTASSMADLANQYGQSQANAQMGLANAKASGVTSGLAGILGGALGGLGSGIMQFGALNKAGG